MTFWSWIRALVSIFLCGVVFHLVLDLHPAETIAVTVCIIVIAFWAADILDLTRRDHNA